MINRDPSSRPKMRERGPEQLSTDLPFASRERYRSWRPLWSPLSLLLSLIAIAPLCALPTTLRADEGAQPERLHLICTEQPMRAVSFGEQPGALSYGEQPPKESGPIEVLVTKRGPGEDFSYDFAVIESSTPDLATEEAIWLPGKQIEAQRGRFKINLENLIMTLTETDPDGSARFRRFSCETRLSGR